jgi:hypothetical protein
VQQLGQNIPDRLRNKKRSTCIGRVEWLTMKSKMRYVHVQSVPGCRFVPANSAGTLVARYPPFHHRTCVTEFFNTTAFYGNDKPFCAVAGVVHLIESATCLNCLSSRLSRCSAPTSEFSEYCQKSIRIVVFRLQLFCVSASGRFGSRRSCHGTNLMGSNSPNECSASAGPR